MPTETGVATPQTADTSIMSDTTKESSAKQPKEFRGPELGIHYIADDLKLFLSSWSDAWLFEAYSVNPNTVPAKLIDKGKLLPLGNCNRMTVDAVKETNGCIVKADISSAKNFILFKLSPLARPGSVMRLSSTVQTKRAQLLRRSMMGNLMELEGNILTIIFHHSKAEIIQFLDYDCGVEFFADEKVYNRAESFAKNIEHM